jgi:hypothetical protein
MIEFSMQPNQNPSMVPFVNKPTLQSITDIGAITNKSITVGGITDTSKTAGSVLFAGVSGLISQDNANFFYDDTNNRLGIGTNNPQSNLHVYNASSNVSVSYNTGVNLDTSLELVEETPSGKHGGRLYTDGTNNIFKIQRALNTIYTDVITIPYAGTYVGNVGIGVTSPLAKLHINTVNTTDLGLLVKGVSGQTASLQEWQNNTGTILAEVDELGNASFGATNPTPITGTGRGIYIGGANNATIYMNGVKQWRITSTSSGSFTYRNETDNVNAFEIRNTGVMGVGMGSQFSSMTNVGKLAINDQGSTGSQRTALSLSNLGTANLSTEVRLDFNLKDSGSAVDGDVMARVRTGITDLTDGSSDGSLIFQTRVNDTLTDRLTLNDGGVKANASFTLPYRAITALRTLDATDYTVDCTANSFTVTLPTAVGITGRIYQINNSGTGTITVDANGTETINGDLTQTLSQHEQITVQSTGSNWILIH